MTFANVLGADLEIRRTPEVTSWVSLVIRNLY